MVTDRIIPEEYKERIRILVVEDNALNQTLASYMLNTWGFRYDVATDGKDALERIRKRNYDLVLLDIQMPEMNGYETANYIRNELKLGMPIIAITSSDSPGDRERCLSSGMTDYIAKPVQPVDLFNLVNNYLFSTVVENVENKMRRMAS
jgi:CheY-like chemotaxis protein